MKNLTVEYLQNKFHIYNKKFFNNELPDIKIELCRSKRAFGQFCWTYSREDKNKILSRKIRISTYYDSPAHEIQDTLIHEMIHYYIQVKNIKDTGVHGYYFMKIANDINNKSTYHISAFGDATNLKLTKEKIYRIMKFNYNGKTYYTRVSKKFNYKNLIIGNQMKDVQFLETKDTTFDLWMEGRVNIRYYGESEIKNIKKIKFTTIAA